VKGDGKLVSREDESVEQAAIGHDAQDCQVREPCSPPGQAWQAQFMLRPTEQLSPGLTIGGRQGRMPAPTPSSVRGFAGSEEGNFDEETP